ncbi:MAG TPA: hypothetical protein VHT28_04630 [Silvibacterium sp.]|jgi:hypothetical protein|nr:hypothetical protein [Silvibacterium sp.]
MTAFKNLRLDLICSATLANIAQVGRAISPNAGDGMAAFAALRVEDHCASFMGIRI